MVGEGKDGRRPLAMYVAAADGRCLQKKLSLLDSVTTKYVGVAVCCHFFTYQVECGKPSHQNHL